MKDIYGTEYTTYGGNAPTAGGTVLVRDSSGSLVEKQWMGQVIR